MLFLVFLVFLSAFSSTVVWWLGSVVLSGLPGVSAERMSYIENGECEEAWAELQSRLNPCYHPHTSNEL